MRVTYLAVEAHLGGAERCLLDAIAAVRAVRPDLEASLIVGLGEGPLIDVARARGVEVHPLPLPARLATLGDTPASGRSRAGRALGAGARLAASAPALLGYVARLRRTLAALRPDVVHSHGLKFHLLGALALPRGAAFAWHLHDFLGARPAASRAMHVASRRVDRAIAISRAVAEDARRALPGVPIELVYNAVDTDAFAPGPPREGLEDAPKAPPDGVLRVGIVATYARWKGQDIFLDAAARVAATHANVRFYVVGGPIYRTRASQFSTDELMARARSLGIAERVVFVPFRAAIEDAYRSLDVVVHASRDPEPFGRTIAEAMACARAVVVSSAGGASELFRDGEDALGVPPADVAALARAVATLVDDAALRGRVGARARETAIARFGLPRFGQELARVYDDAVRHRLTARGSRD